MSDEKNGNIKTYKNGKKNKRNKLNFLYILGGGLIVLITIFLIVINIPEDTSEIINNNTSPDVKAQRENLQKQKKKEKKAEENIYDRVYSSPKHKSNKENDILSEIISNYEKQKKKIDEKDETNENTDLDIIKDINRKEIQQSKNINTFPDESSKKNDYFNEKYKKKAKTSLFSYSKTYKNAEFYDDKNQINNETKKESKNYVNYKNKTGINVINKNDEIKIENENEKIIYNNLDIVKITEGTFVNCLTVNKVISDINESPIVCRSYKDLISYDGKYVVFPAGTMFIGKSKRVTNKAANRLFIVYQKIILPNSIIINLGESNYQGLANDGVMGAKTKINRHFMLKYGSAFLFGILSGLGGLTNNYNSSNALRNFIAETNNNFEEINTSYFNEFQGVMPTITIDPGTKVLVYVSKSFYISAFSFVSDRYYMRDTK